MTGKGKRPAGTGRSQNVVDFPGNLSGSADSPPVVERRPNDDGAAVLDAIRDTLEQYVVFPRAEASAALTLWIAATHRQDAWEHATRLVLKSPIKRCGKTRAQEIGRELVHHPIATSNISSAALVRSIDEADPPTLFLDEADAIFGKTKEAREGAEDLRGILNSGHSRGWPYIRWDVKARATEECPTFAMALLGGIGDMPDTVEDRAVVIAMRRRAPGEPVKAFRRRRVVPVLHALRDRLHAWARSLDGLEDAEPDLPVEDREADTWEPLVAIADAAGGHWPATARKACLALCGDVSPDDATLGERLLADLAAVWAADEGVLFTAAILDRLHALEEAPWDDLRGRPLTDRGLARLLRPYGVRSKNLRHGMAVVKGYSRADLADAWARYVTPATRQRATAATPPHDASNPAMPSPNVRSGSVADSDSATATCPEQEEESSRSGVAAVTDASVDDAAANSALDAAQAILADAFGPGVEEVPSR